MRTSVRWPLPERPCLSVQSGHRGSCRCH
jgi:hypothetical protein